MACLYCAATFVRDVDRRFHFKGHDVVFRGRGTLDLREDKFFGTESPGSRICPFPSISFDVAAGVAGRTTGLAGLRLGRTGFAPVGQLTHVSERDAQYTTHSTRLFFQSRASGA